MVVWLHYIVLYAGKGKSGRGGNETFNMTINKVSESIFYML